MISRIPGRSRRRGNARAPVIVMVRHAVKIEPEAGPVFEPLPHEPNLGRVASARRVGGGREGPVPRVGSLDDVVRPRQQRRWDREAEGVRGLEVNRELEPRGLLDGQVGGFRAVQNLGHVGR
jgi:hypothetical protein